MSAAAHSFPVDRMSEWLEELERVMKAFDALPSAAQAAVKSVVESLVRDPDTSDVEIAHLNALLALRRPGSDDGRHQRRASLSHKRTQYAHRAALALPQQLVVAPVDSHAHAARTLPVYVQLKGRAVWL
jgi:hypothetical protein